MFETLSDRLSGAVKRLRGRGRLTEADVSAALEEIRVALLEADVDLDVVRAFVDRVRLQAIGAQVSAALDPGQQIVKTVDAELRRLLGGEALAITYTPTPPTVVMLAGLQGSGKTTSAAKLARWFKSEGRNPLLVGVDLQRPAAVEQLRVLGEQVGVPVFSQPGDPVSTARAGIAEATRLGRDVVIVDTAGRLAIDEELMREVSAVSDAVTPRFTFLVVDAMTGQDAARVARTFDERLAIDGVILTKLDGDARGGAALSVKEVTGKPIAFAGVGEKLEDFERFHPDRMATRILGMGDVLTLIEKAEQVYEKGEAERQAAKLLGGEFTLEDFLDQLQQLKKMGPLSGVLGMMPGMPKLPDDAELPDELLRTTEAIIRSMTPEERRRPEVINGSRRTRIAKGSGTQVADVNRVVKQFLEMRKMMKQMGGRGGRMGGLAGALGGRPGAR